MASRVKVDEKRTAKSPALQRARLAALSNLIKSKKPGDLEKYFKRLSDFEFLTQKIHHPDFGLQALIEDYDLIDAPEATTHPEYDPEKVKALKQIQGALRLSAHVLANDKTQLAGQLLGRLLPLPPVTSRQAQSQQKQADYRYFWEYIPWIGNFLAKYSQKDLTVEADPTATAPNINQSPIIQELLEQAKQWKQSPWLRPLTPSLTPPGGQLLRTLSGHSSSVTAVALTPDGKQAISASGDNTLKVWDLATGKQLRTLTGHSDWVTAVALTPDGKQAISASNDKTLKLWDLATGEELRTLNEDSHWITLTPDGKQAISASGDNTLKLWDFATREELRTLNGHRGPVTAVAVTVDGKQAISASYDNTLIVWDLATGKQLRTLTGHTFSVDAVALTPDGKQAISASSDSTLIVWDLATGKQLRTLTGHSDWVTAVALTPDGKQAISASRDKTIKLWDLTTGEEHRIDMRLGAASLSLTLWWAWKPRTLNGHSDWINAVAVTVDSKQAISASDDNTLKLWDLETGQQLRTLNGHSDWVKAIALTPDGKQVISTSDDNTLKLWDLETGEELRTLTGHTLSVYAVAVTVDGKQAISASDDNTLKLWDLEIGEELRTLNGHSDSVNAVAITPDGKQVISASKLYIGASKSIGIKDPMHTLKYARSSVNAVAVTPDGKQAIFASGDNTLKLWNLETGEVIASFTGESRIKCCAVAPDGVTIVAGEVSGRVHLLRLEGMEASP